MLRATNSEVERIGEVPRRWSKATDGSSAIGRRPSQSKLTEAEEAEIVSAYTSGSTVYEVAELVRCDRRTVSEALKRNGVTMRRQSPSSEAVDEMVRLRSTGISLAQIGAKVGYDPKTVLNHLRQRHAMTRDSHGRPQ